MIIMAVKRHRNLFKTEKTRKQKIVEWGWQNQNLVAVMGTIMIFLIIMVALQTTSRADYLIPYGSL